MEYNVPQKTRVLVWEGEDRNHVVTLNKSKRSIEAQVLHCWSCGLLTDFYMKHGQASLVRLLERYFNHVENWTGRLDGDSDPNIITIFVTNRKGNV